MKGVQGYILLSFLFVFEHASSSALDSGKKHEILIIPDLEYCELPIMTSPMGPGTDLTFGYTHTSCPEMGCTLNYEAIGNVGVSAAINEQSVQNTILNIKELNYMYSSSPYSLSVSPEYVFSLDYIRSTDWGEKTVGLEINYQTSQLVSAGSQQSDYPTALRFSCLNTGIHAIYYINIGEKNKLNLYLGGRLCLSFWNETNNWTAGAYNLYVPLINSSDNIQLNLQVLGGMKYFIVPHLGIQMEGGLGRLYYAQFAIIIRLNH